MQFILLLGLIYRLRSNSLFNSSCSGRSSFLISSVSHLFQAFSITSPICPTNILKTLQARALRNRNTRNTLLEEIKPETLESSVAYQGIAGRKNNNVTTALLIRTDLTHCETNANLITIYTDEPVCAIRHKKITLILRGSQKLGRETFEK